jgi:hypothetical protein
MNDELLAMVERDVLDWPGVSKETHRGGPGQGGFWVPPATVYKFGCRALGHVHGTGVADLTFPREIHDQLISDGWAKQHGGWIRGCRELPYSGAGRRARGRGTLPHELRARKRLR